MTGAGIGELLGASNHTAWFDLDRDGDQDFFEFNDDGYIHPSRFWENLGMDGSGNVQWDERKPDTGMGTLLGPMGVVIHDLDGDRLPDIWVSDAEQVDRIDVWWPDSQRSHTSLGEVCANCRIVIHREGVGGAGD